MIRSFIFVSLIAGALGQSCSVCGDGKEVGNADAIFAFPGQPAVPCGLLEAAGQGGAIPLDQCAFLPPLITICECMPSPSGTPAPITPAPADVPTTFPTPSPPISAPSPAPIPLPTAVPTAQPTTFPTPSPPISAPSPAPTGTTSLPTPPAPAGTTDTILDIVVASPDHTTLEAAVVAAPSDVAELLSDATATLTLFAPDDNAFAAVPSDYLADLLTEPWADHLVCFLSSHVLGTVVSSNAITGPAGVISLSGYEFEVNREGDVVTVDGIPVTAADIEALNGVIHVISAQPILPPCVSASIYDQGAALTTFSTVISLIDKAGLAETLKTTRPLTLFAPTNDAFDKVDPTILDYLGGNVTALTEVLTYHVIAANEFFGKAEQNAGSFVTLNGDSLDVSYEGDAIRVNANTDGATIDGIDILASNGVVQIVDTVLIPPSLYLPPLGTPGPVVAETPAPAQAPVAKTLAPVVTPAPYTVPTVPSPVAKTLAPVVPAPVAVPTSPAPVVPDTPAPIPVAPTPKTPTAPYSNPTRPPTPYGGEGDDDDSSSTGKKENTGGEDKYDKIEEGSKKGDDDDDDDYSHGSKKGGKGGKKGGDGSKGGKKGGNKYDYEDDEDDDAGDDYGSKGGDNSSGKKGDDDDSSGKKGDGDDDDSSGKKGDGDDDDSSGKKGDDAVYKYNEESYRGRH